MRTATRLRVSKLLQAAVLLFSLSLSSASAPPGTEPFRDPKLQLEQRVANLVSLLTLEEKIAWLGQVVPANERLQIKTFTNWTEGLHGLGWVIGGSVTATQFPQSIGLASTWDPELLRQVGHVIGY